MDNMARKKYMGVWRWWSKWIIVTMITLPDRVRKYNVRKTTKKASLCCQLKLEKPSKRNSTTKVTFDFNIETSVYFRELGTEQKAVMGQTWTRVGWTRSSVKNVSTLGKAGGPRVSRLGYWRTAHASSLCYLSFGTVELFNMTMRLRAQMET